MVHSGACFHFIDLFCFEALTVKVEKTCKKTLFKGSFYKMPKVKNYFLFNIYFIYRYSKIKRKGNVAFFHMAHLRYPIEKFSLNRKITRASL